MLLLLLLLPPPPMGGGGGAEAVAAGTNPLFVFCLSAERTVMYVDAPTSCGKFDTPFTGNEKGVCPPPHPPPPPPPPRWLFQGLGLVQHCGQHFATPTDTMPLPLTCYSYYFYSCFFNCWCSSFSVIVKKILDLLREISRW